MGCTASRASLVDQVDLGNPIKDTNNNNSSSIRRHKLPSKKNRWYQRTNNRKQKNDLQTNSQSSHPLGTNAQETHPRGAPPRMTTHQQPSGAQGDAHFLTLLLDESNGRKRLGYSCSLCHVAFIPLRERDEHLQGTEHQDRCQQLPSSNRIFHDFVAECYVKSSVATSHDMPSSSSRLFRGIFGTKKRVTWQEDPTATPELSSSSSAESLEETNKDPAPHDKYKALLDDVIESASQTNQENRQIVVYQPPPPINDKYICPVVGLGGHRGFKCTLCDLPFFTDKAQHETSEFHTWALDRVVQTPVNRIHDKTLHQMALHFVSASINRWSCSLCHDLGIEKSLGLAMERMHIYGRLHFELSDMYEMPSMQAQLEWNTQNPHQYIFFTQACTRTRCHYAVCTLCEMRIQPSFQGITEHVNGRIHQALLLSSSSEKSRGGTVPGETDDDSSVDVDLAVLTHVDPFMDDLDSLLFPASPPYMDSPHSVCSEKGLRSGMGEGIIDKRCQYHRQGVRETVERVLQQHRAKECIEALCFFSAFVF